MDASDVTIICATRNAADAVRLTFESLRRSEPTGYRLLVADNGSTDGTLEFLASLDWVQLFRGDGCQSHGAALDWLTRKVTTRYFLTMDSDVVFLRPGWLADLRRVAQENGAAAVGELEPGSGAYRSRLAPYVLLLDTDRIRALGSSFESCAVIRDPAEALRWRRRPRTEHVDYSEVRRYRSATFYPTGGRLFECINQAGQRWAATPPRTRRKYRHLGHMSWAAAEAPFAAAHNAKLSKVRAILAKRASADRPRLRNERFDGQSEPFDAT